MSSVVHADSPKGRKELDEEQKEQVVDYLMVYGTAGKAEISEALGLNRTRLDRLLIELEMDGIICKRGSLQRPNWSCSRFNRHENKNQS